MRELIPLCPHCHHHHRPCRSSYETTALWPLLQQPPAGLSLDFVKAERSTFRWGGADEAAIRGAGHGVHLLPNSGHW